MNIVEYAERISGCKLLSWQKDLLMAYNTLPRDSKLVYHKGVFRVIKYEEKKDDRIIVVCRTCGEKWFYPKQYEQCFDADHPLENCAFCKRRKI